MLGAIDLVMRAIPILIRGPSTGWQITGTTGAAVGGSFLNVLSGGGAVGHIYVKDKQNQEHDLDFIAIDGGIGSPDISSPVYLDTGFKELPSSAVGKICYVRPTSYGDEMVKSDLTGMFVELQYSCHLTSGAASISIIFMGAPGIVASAGVIPAAALPAAMAASKAVGIVANTSVQVAGIVGFGGTLRYGYIADTPI